jgi:hypothetical protein
VKDKRPKGVRQRIRVSGRRDGREGARRRVRGVRLGVDAIWFEMCLFSGQIETVRCPPGSLPDPTPDILQLGKVLEI